MKILLINSNPVVSRLTALSARKEEIHIDEVQEINELSNNKYDIVFVDSDSWSNELDTAISKKIKTQKRVLFYAQDDTNNKELFDISILKPFLPSEVSAVIRSVEEYTLSENDTKEDIIELEEEDIFNTLETSANKKEEKKEDFLISLDDNINLDEKLPTAFDELGKDNTMLELTKKDKKEDKEEDLFADLKDNNKDFDKQLEEAFPLKKEEDLFDLDFSSNSLEKEFEALDKKSIKVEKDELFDFDFDNNAMDLNLNTLNDDKINIDSKVNTIDKEEKNIEMPNKKVEKIEEKLETKILDSSEVLNIKDILENDDSPTLELEELMTPTVETVKISDENKKKDKTIKIEHIDESSSLEADTLIDTINSLPIDKLKGLLAGSTIKITIKFPKVK